MPRSHAPARPLRLLTLAVLAALLACAASACDDDPGPDNAPTDATDMATEDTAPDAAQDTSTVDTADDLVDTLDDTATGDAGDDTGDDTAEVDMPPMGIDATFTFVSLLDDSPLANLDVKIGAETKTTDASGQVAFALMPGVAFQATLTSAEDAIRPHYLYDTAPDDDVAYSYALTTEGTLDALANALGLPIDPTDGILSVRVRDADTRDSIADMTVTTSGTYDEAIVYDSAAMGGLAVGNVTKPDSLANVIFVNHASGPVSPRFDHPGGYTCIGRDPVGVPAEAVAISTYDCEIVPIDLTVTIVDFASGAPLPGVEVALDTQTATTDASGTVTLETVPNAALELVATGSGMRTQHFLLEAPATSGALTFEALTDSAVTAIESELGVTVDDTDGIFAAAVTDARTLEPIPGTTISVSAAADLVAVYDDSAASGLVPGDTTGDSTPTAAMFVNVPAGSLSADFAHPYGYTCGGAPTAVDVPAGAYVYAAYDCTFEPINYDITVTDIVSGAAQANVAIQVADQQATTDASGQARLTLPANSVLDWKLTGANIREHHFHRRTPPVDAEGSLIVATNSAVTTLQTAFGVPLTATTGVVAISAYDAQTGQAIPAMQIGLDTTLFDAQLVADASAPNPKLSTGDTTRTGSRPTSYFLNVDADTIEASFTHPWGFTCTLGDEAIPVPDGTWVEARYLCDFNRVEQTVRFVNFGSNMPLRMLTVSSILQVDQTNTQGEVVLDLPANQNVRLAVNGQAIRPHTVYAWPRTDGMALGFSPATETTIDGLETSLGVTVDNSDGLVAVTLADATTRDPVEGVTVELSTSYDTAFVTDSTAMGGLAPGNTTAAASAANVLFINAAPTVGSTVSFSDTNGTRNCQGQNPLPIDAGRIVISQYLCP